MRSPAALLLPALLLLLPGCDRRSEPESPAPLPAPREPSTPSSEERVAHSLEELQRLIPPVGEAVDGTVQRQIPPLGETAGQASTPAAASIELATYCDPRADPATARYITFNPMLAAAISEGVCYLAGGRGGSLLPHSGAASRVELNLEGNWCGRDVDDLQRAVEQPDSLYVRLPGSSGRVEARVREMGGTVAGGEFLPEAFGEWRVVYSDAVDGRVLVLDVEDLRGAAASWVQLEVAIEGSASRTVDLTWPVGC